MINKNRFLLGALVWVAMLPACSLAQTVSKLALTPNPAIGNGSATGTVTISKAAPSAGLKITLVSTAPKVASVPASLTIASGATTGTFVVATGHVLAASRSVIEAKDPTGHLAEQSLEVEPPAVRVSHLSVAPTAVPASESAVGTVKLTAESTLSGFTVSLTSKSSAAVVPSSVTFAKGTSSVTFAVKTSTVTANTPTTLTATDPYGYTATASLNVELPAVRVTKLAITPTSATVSAPVTGTVTLSAIAPKGGFSVTLTSSQPFLTLPGTVTVKQGAKTGTFSGATGQVRAASSATVTASDAAGYSANASVTVNPPASFLSGMTINPTGVPSGGQATCSLQLSSAAPTGGIVVSLSTMSGFLTVPLTMTIPAGSNSAQVTIKAGDITSTSVATVTGLDSKGYSASSSVTVIPAQTAYVVQLNDQHQFLPTTITVPAGSSVTWINNPSTMAHSVTSDVFSQGINSGVIAPGQSFSWTVPASAKSGTVFYYHCIYHGFAGNGTSLGIGMAGAVVVK